MRFCFCTWYGAKKVAILLTGFVKIDVDLEKCVSHLQIYITGTSILFLI